MQVEANQPVANYWIRSPMTVSGASSNKNRAYYISHLLGSNDVHRNARSVNTNDVFAVLHYAGAPNAEPTTKADSSPNGVLLQEQNLKAST